MSVLKHKVTVRMWIVIAAIVCALVLVFFACIFGTVWLIQSDRWQSLQTEVYARNTFVHRTREHVVKVQTISDNLNFPWGIVLLPGEREALISEKVTAILTHVDLETGKETDLYRVPHVVPVSAGDHCGLLDISLDPRFSENHYIYFAYTAGSVVGHNVRPQIARAKLQDKSITDFEILLSTDSGISSIGTCGMRMAWLPDETLLISVGHDVSGSAQNPGELRGKIIRIHRDGSVPTDNPFVGNDMFRDEIYTLGHRDPQGLFVTTAGTIWSVEHGPYGGDELNLIEAGSNYGWSEVSYGVRYPSHSFISRSLEFIGLKKRISAAQIELIGGVRTHSEAGFVEPIAVWGMNGTRSIAPSGMLVYSGKQFEHWAGDIFIATLFARHIRRVALSSTNVDEQEVILHNKIGRTRHLIESSAGEIYIITDSQIGKLIKLSKIK